MTETTLERRQRQAREAIENDRAFRDPEKRAKLVEAEKQRRAGTRVGASERWRIDWLGLTPERCAALEALASGATQDEAAEAAGIARSTMVQHLDVLMELTGAGNILQLILTAWSAGAIQIDYEIAPDLEVEIESYLGTEADAIEDPEPEAPLWPWERGISESAYRCRSKTCGRTWIRRTPKLPKSSACPFCGAAGVRTLRRGSAERSNDADAA